MRNIRFVVLGNPLQLDKNVFIGQVGTSKLEREGAAAEAWEGK